VEPLDTLPPAYIQETGLCISLETALECPMRGIGTDFDQVPD
jgi:hypothetical protein